MNFMSLDKSGVDKYSTQVVVNFTICKYFLSYPISTYHIKGKLIKPKTFMIKLVEINN